MKRALQTTCLILALFPSTVIMNGCAKHSPAPQPVLPAAAIDKTESKNIIVAKVNNIGLSMDLLVQMMNRLPEKSGGSPESLKERKMRALDSMILQELAWQRAKVLGIELDPHKIDLAIDNFKNNVGGDAKYVEYLGSNKLTETDLRSEVERSLAIELIYSREVVEKTTVPEEELKKEYERDKQRYTLPEKVTVVDVHLLRKDSNNSRGNAGELLARIKDAGEDPWKLVLDGTFTVRRRAVRPDREKELYDTAKKLKLQELSGLIDTPSGVHIVKLESYLPEKVLLFDEAKSQLEIKLKGPYLEKRTHEWEQELRKDAKIEIVDPGAGSQDSEVRSQRAEIGKN